MTSGVLIYTAFPEQWYEGEWVWHGYVGPVNSIVVTLTYAVALLVSAMLVVRARRIGRTAAALTATTAWHTAVFFVLTLRGLLSGPSSFGQAMALVAWPAVAWLLSGTARPCRCPRRSTVCLSGT
ncbi:hypothetical protein EDD27_2112 [Nonomuraea polychroma]|uniref:Uncharacterized protein n=1 Tax=Nonomuraea polychroma TaxID=46176 RepID=A0A438M1P2_9ACTN|nr:hypothetical protein EDD27_2112 [Nonomuraea polychroma]